ncbi:PSD1 and planctomycete cytochrome C domain-containing protein [Opitutales bacterium]|jgi:hypothetical protein|nr:PSD1 and planctomycete cytochrome C domain-containing protein [Opitutales bacterium]
MPTSYKLSFGPHGEVAKICLALLSPCFTSAAIDQQSLAPMALSILAENCLDCHGPDKKKRKGDLRLDQHEGATKDLGGHKAIDPGNPDKSELLIRLHPEDEDDLMPPKKTERSLTQKEIGVLRQWITAGAPYPTHWAYRSIESSIPPKVNNESDVLNPIDRFVLARLDSLDQKPSPRADRRTLVKRLHYDLLGLPAPIKRVDTFVEDQSPEAYSKLVNELLRSPHFGERWGRHWLDMARYADSDGYEKDKARPSAWRFRDWVIQAINDDLPYDRFTIEQLAGDLIPEATEEQRLATAFHRQTLTNTEGGTDKEQWRVAAVMDRVETTGSVWLGLTLTCARCHDHKYDNISQDNYYQLFAFFNNGDETTHTVTKSKDGNKNFKEGKASHDKKVAELEKRIKNLLSSRRDDQGKWEEQTKARIAAIKNPIAHHPIKLAEFTKLEDYKLVRQVDNSVFVEKLSHDTATFHIDATVDTGGKPITGFRIEVFADPKLPSKGPGLASHGNFVLNEFRAFVVDLVDADKRRPLIFYSARADFSQKGWDVKGAIDGIEKTGWAISSEMGKSHQAAFRLGKPLLNKNPGRLRFELAQLYGSRHVIGRFRIMAVTGEESDDFAPEDIRQAILTDASKRSDAQRKLLADHFTKTDPEVGKLRKQLEDLRKKAPKTPTMSVRVITQRKGNPRKTHVFRRGEFKQPLHEVHPNGLTVLHPLKARDEQESGDRLDFARWLVEPSNPITPRVTVNQIWGHLFGYGLVRTPGDFGIRGEAPSHPDLLDWLAHYFVEDAKWSRKKLIRLIVHSSTYRQSSVHRSEFVQLDPNNKLLHRQNRFRVEAEIVRDLNLALAGLLSYKVGGPSVFPPLPSGIANLSYANSFKWNTSKGEDRYRRGLYTFFKRTSPHPNLLTFDCPDSNVACVKRNRSNTPLAALVTLNNATFTEAAKAFAERMLKEALPEDEKRIAHGFRLCVARTPEPHETLAFLALLNESRSWFKKNPEDAKAFAGDPEIAAWAATSRIILNMDEFLTRE